MTPLYGIKGKRTVKGTVGTRMHSHGPKHVCVGQTNLPSESIVFVNMHLKPHSRLLLYSLGCMLPLVMVSPLDRRNQA